MDLCAFGLLIDCKENYETVFKFLLTAVFGACALWRLRQREAGDPGSPGKSPGKTAVLQFENIALSNPWN